MKKNTKKQVLLAITIAVIFLTGGGISKSYDWSLLAPPPECGNWGTAKDAMICNIAGCDPNCCFHVVYYDRWTGPNNNEYELSIAGVFWENPSCSSCVSAPDGVIFPLLQMISKNNPNFMTKVLSTGRGAEIVGTQTYIYIYRKAFCFDNNENLCDVSIKRCCRIKYGLSFTRVDTPYVVSGMGCDWWTNTNTETVPPCTTQTCHSECFSVPMGIDPDPCTLCNEEYFWEQQPEQSINYVCCYKDCPDPNCDPNQLYCYTSNCKLKFKYSIRKPKSSISTCIYKEYRLDEWSHCSDVCKNDDIPKMHQAIIEYLINFGPITNPDIDETVTNVRMTESVCWKSSLNLDLSENAMRFTWSPCIGDSVCCQTVWSVHNYGLPIGTLCSLITRSTQLQSLCSLNINNLNQCQNFCDGITTRPLPRINETNDIASETQKIMTKPNPTQSKTTIEIISDEIGEIEIQIRNVLGELVEIIMENKNTKSINIYIDGTNYPMGAYYYQVFINKHPYSKINKFIIY